MDRAVIVWICPLATGGVAKLGGEIARVDASLSPRIIGVLGYKVTASMVIEYPVKNLRL